LPSGISIDKKVTRKERGRSFRVFFLADETGLLSGSAEQVLHKLPDLRKIEAYKKCHKGKDQFLDAVNFHLDLPHYFLRPDFAGAAFFTAGFTAVFAAGFAGVLARGFLAGAGLPLAGALGGGAVPPALGGTARIRHLGPEPIRSSR
jgi:hypothetical protein